MAKQQIFTQKWANIISGTKTIAHGMMKAGNFYEVVVYRYADPPTTRILAGTDTAYIFMIGRFTDKKVFIPALKLKHVNPEKFFDGIRLGMNVLTEELIDESDEFRLLMRKFPTDGKPLFEMLKRKPVIYEGNYREYKMTSIKSVKLITIDKEYIKDKFLPEYRKQAKVNERTENLND